MQSNIKELKRGGTYVLTVPRGSLTGLGFSPEGQAKLDAHLDSLRDHIKDRDIKLIMVESTATVENGSWLGRLRDWFTETMDRT